MPDNDYEEAVVALLEGGGWDVSTTRVREDSVLVRGTRGDGGESELLGLVVVGNDVTGTHVKYLLKTASERRPNEVLVTTPGELTADARDLAAEYDVAVVDSETVADETAGGDDSTTGDSAGDDTAVRPATARAADSPDATSERNASTTDGTADDRTAGGTAADGTAVAGGPDANAERTDAGSTPATGRWSRRDVLAVGGVAAVAAGGWFAYTELGDSGPNGPEEVVRAFYGAIDDGNVARARELIHEDGEQLDPANVRDRSIEIVSLERVESDRENVAAFDVTIRVDGSYTDNAVVTVRENDDGDWRMVTV